jgi:2-polyprenyl-6-methoxyphenol hydroxylase-like FAD-dependent oxidoreductase
LTPPNLTIYERDSNAVPAGREGYTFSLAGYDKTGGLYAAHDLGILDDVMKHAVQGLGSKLKFTMWNSSWKELLTQTFEPAPGLPTSGIRIARKNLRKVLTDAVGREQIIWNTACVDAEKLPNGKMLVKLSEGQTESTAECDLLIIADGASSKLRASQAIPCNTLELCKKAAWPSSQTAYQNLSTKNGD